MKIMEKTNQVTKSFFSILLMLVLVLVGIRPVMVDAAEVNISVEKVNFKDFSNWRSGNYNCSSGKYTANATRLCLNDYVTVSGGEYKVLVNNANYRLLIRELDRNKKLVKSYDLMNGKIYIPSTNAYYLGISIYKTSGTSGITYASYSQLFSNGFYAGLETLKSGMADTTTSSDDTTTDEIEIEETVNESVTIDNKEYSVADIDYKDFSNWRSGNYHHSTGNYIANKSRLCLNDYVTVSDGEYKVCVKNSAYHLLIRELDENKKFIKSYNLADGKSYVPSSNAKYLGISIYKVSGESSVTYDTFKSLFANGFYVGLEVVEEIPSEESDIVIDDIIMNQLPNYGSSRPVLKDKETLFKEELLELLETGDTTPHDFSEYEYTWQKVSELFEEVTENEGRIPFASCANMYYTTTKTSDGLVLTLKLENIDDGYAQRYQSLKKIVENIVSQSEGMTELEKTILAHDYVVSHCSYYKGELLYYTAGSALVDGKALCTGYARAMVLLLQEMDVECEVVAASAMPHAWVKVKIDGQWYHADPTWDDTRSAVKGKVSHTYLLRTDAEFSTGGNNKHYGWEGTISTDTTFTNWSVHDIVGELHHSDGNWYYINSEGQKITVDIDK